eukprot:TRINITY_DN69_c0_g1_i2.p1 TRINITY_DN69_c0_g1~~TRINITY_DN69_c0_g1_i2.p1  ORF type:complete len:117 (-),score=44.21 TRINITY_DN69_c0_g1_i2:133-483(-)
MRHVAAYLLAKLGGKENPTEADITTILEAAGVEADTEKISKLLSELEGKDLNEVLAAGRAKLSAVPSGGGGGGARSGGAAASSASSGGGAPKQEEEAEKEKEPSEEEEAMTFDLFG